MTDTPDGITGKVPDFPETRLALRAWIYNRAGPSVRSLNAPMGKASWMAAAMADPVGDWPHRQPLQATCKTEHDEGVPDPRHSCGIYATADLDVIGGYLSADAPVLGIVELGGRVIPAQQGYRAQYARVAAILLVDPVLTLPHGTLRKLAVAYRVPALVPHSVDPEDYRDLIVGTPLADEVDRYLREQGL
jgi:hypothetical protein